MLSSVMEKKTTTIALNSNNRVGGTPESFSVNFLPALHRVKRWAIKRVAIPKTFYTINESNRTLVVWINGVPGAFPQVPVGTYTGDELATAMEVALGPYTAPVSWEITWDPITRKFTFTGTNTSPVVVMQLTYKPTNNPTDIFNWLGFNATAPFTITYPLSTGPGTSTPVPFTSINAVNMNMYAGMILRSTYLSGRNPDPNFHSNATGADMRYSTFVTFIPFTVDHDEEMVQYEPQELHWNETDGGTITTMDWTLDWSWYPGTISGFSLNNPVGGWEVELFIEN